MSRPPHNMFVYRTFREVSPCKDCAGRHTACHDRCERYKEWLINLEKVKQERRKHEQFRLIKQKYRF